MPASSMLDEWEENLAIITANRTKDDELVIIHLGDCLLKERTEVYILFSPMYAISHMMHLDLSFLNTDYCCTYLLLGR